LCRSWGETQAFAEAEERVADATAAGVAGAGTAARAVVRAAAIDRDFQHTTWEIENELADHDSDVVRARRRALIVAPDGTEHDLLPLISPLGVRTVRARRTGGRDAMGLMTGAIELSLPFAGLWLARNSPARRVPSHGTDLLGGRYAIDFIGVDQRRRTADRRDWRTFLATEPPQRYLGFGRPILAPADGQVVGVHDGEIDHGGRRSQLSLVPYALGQAARLRQGARAIAGNHVVIALPGGAAFVALAHLRAGTVRVAVGEEVTIGQPLGECGNSGNSTQPHVHLQVMDKLDLPIASGVPMVFRRFREWTRGSKQPQVRESGIPAEGSVVEPLPS
jgi:hypothetical protein